MDGCGLSAGNKMGKPVEGREVVHRKFEGRRALGELVDIYCLLILVFCIFFSSCISFSMGVLLATGQSKHL